MKAFGWQTLAVVGIASCSSKAAEPKSETVSAPLVARDAAPKTPVVEVASPIAASGQLVVAVSEGWNDSKVEIMRFDRTNTGSWTRVSLATGELGSAGLGWGIGLHGVGAPDGAEGPIKEEGDRRSPAGGFALGQAYGYADSPPERTRIDYTPLDSSWRCVDDPASKHYNELLRKPSGNSVDWNSAEKMRRSDELYRWVVLVDHNGIRAEGSTRGRAPTPGSGSCIFLHVWRDKGSATVGCAAMDRTEIESTIAWLDPVKKPSVVMLPRAEYKRLASQWGLPAI